MSVVPNPEEKSNDWIAPERDFFEFRQSGGLLRGRVGHLLPWVACDEVTAHLSKRDQEFGGSVVRQSFATGWRKIVFNRSGGTRRGSDR